MSSRAIKRWQTKSQALAYITTVQERKSPIGLKYCAALDCVNFHN